MNAPDPEGRGAAAAIARALVDAELRAEEIDFVNAHGTGTTRNDPAEWAALRMVFGERLERLPVTSTKGLVGHLLGASGALEAVATILCLEAGRVHATPGGGGVDPELPMHLVLGDPETLARAEWALSTSFGFGGANTALVFGRPREEPEP
jgi:3-oxoacyl-[acyl-carrier-protein] synthase II